MTYQNIIPRYCSELMVGKYTPENAEVIFRMSNKDALDFWEDIKIESNRPELIKKCEAVFL